MTPDQNITAIAIGPDCSPVSSSVSIYYFFDNLLLDDFESFKLFITEVLHPCNDDFTLSVLNDPSFEYQWYLDGVAVQGEVFSELSKMHGDGSYQVRIINAGSCRLTPGYEFKIPEFEIPTNISICDNQSYTYGDRELVESGFYLDTFKTINNCDSIVPLTLQVIGTRFDTLDASVVTDGIYEVANQSFEQAGDYELTLPSSVGCDSLVYLRLSNLDLYIPNTFSPNGDNANDTFAPVTIDGMINNMTIQIFDRWGNIVFEGEDEWDGEGLKTGVYVYNISIGYIDGNNLNYRGSITLVR